MEITPAQRYGCWAFNPSLRKNDALLVTGISCGSRGLFCGKT